MANVLIEESTMSNIAEAIRERSGEWSPMQAHEMPDRIRNIPAGGENGGGGGWHEPAETFDPNDPWSVYYSTRPRDWMAMPWPNENEIYMLVQIPVDGVAYFAFDINANQINQYAYGWTNEDGNFEEIRPIELAENRFSIDFSEVQDWINEHPVAITADGRAQLIVKIAGEQIGSFLVAARPELQDQYCNWNVMEIVCNLPQFQNIRFSFGEYEPFETNKNKSSLRQLRYFTMTGPGQIENFDQMFSGCSSLIAVPELHVESEQCNMRRMFAGCKSLKVAPRFLSETALTEFNFGGMFKDCENLVSVTGFRAEGLNEASDMFVGCYSLSQVTFSDVTQCNVPLLSFENCSFTAKSFEQLVQSLPQGSGKNLNMQGNPLEGDIGPIIEMAREKGWNVQM